MNIIKLLFLSLLFLTICAKADTEVYFSPSTKCEEGLVELIGKAEKSIDVAVYSINNENIVNALKEAYDKGIKIRILTDKVQASNKYSKVQELHNYGLNIRVHSKHKIEHNKFAVFDGQRASTGSYNWTTPATTKNSENCVFFSDDKKIVNDYQKRFEYLWQINTQKASDAWFEKRKANR